MPGARPRLLALAAAASAAVALALPAAASAGNLSWVDFVVRVKYMVPDSSFSNKPLKATVTVAPRKGVAAPARTRRSVTLVLKRR